MLVHSTAEVGFELSLVIFITAEVVLVVNRLVREVDLLLIFRRLGGFGYEKGLEAEVEVGSEISVYGTDS